MDLFSSGDRRAFKKGQSYMGKRASPFLPGRKIFPFHEGKIRTRSAECYPVVLTVGPDSREAVAPRHVSLEMIDA